jgi:hypothetical protein
VLNSNLDLILTHLESKQGEVMVTAGGSSEEDSAAHEEAPRSQGEQMDAKPAE